MRRVIAIEQISPMDSLSVENRSLGCTEYQFYKLINELAKVESLEVICFNAKQNKEKINGVTYDSISNISNYAISNNDYTLFLRPLSDDILDKVKKSKLIWWRHNLYNQTEFLKSKNCFDNTTYFIFPSKDSLLQFNLNYSKNIRNNIVIPNILYEGEFLENKNKCIPRKNNHIVYASGWHKGVEKIVDIIRNYNDFHKKDPVILNIMHPGYGLKDLKSQLNYINTVLPSHSNILGKKGKSEYAFEIKQAFATIAPDFRETFGCVFAESIYLGTPVIYDKKNEPLKDITGDIGICDYNSIETVFRAINFLRYEFNGIVSLDKKYLLENNIELWKKIIL